MKKMIYLLLFAALLPFGTYAVEENKSPSSSLEIQKKEGWQLDLEAFDQEFVFTHCVELPKLENMLNEGHLRIPTPQEWAKGYVYGRLHGKRSADFRKEHSLEDPDTNPEEIVAFIDALWRL